MRSLIKTTFILLFCAGSAFAQVDTAFIAHLVKTGLQVEHFEYIKTVQTTKDSLALLKTRYYLVYQNDSLLLENYAECIPICKNDTVLQKNIGLIMLKADRKLADHWFNDLLIAGATRDLEKIYKAAQNPLQYSADSLIPELQSIFRKLQRVHKKKPVVAALLSTVVPGLGKIYAGKKSSGITNLIINSVYAAQWAESSAKLGYQHAFSWVNAGFFTIFYFANIYGSYNCLYDLRREYKKQFLNDAAFYYK